MKKILILSKGAGWCSTGIKILLLNHLRKDNVRYEKNRSDSIVTDEVTYFFYHIGMGRNLIEFIRRHKKVDAIYSENGYIIDHLRDKNKRPDYLTAVERDLILSLVDSDLSRVGSVFQNTYQILLKEMSRYNIVDVYELRNIHMVRKLSILETEFNWQKHYRTEEEAKEQLKKLAEERIKSLESQIHSERIFINNLYK